MRCVVAVGVALCLACAASAEIVISEWMYSGTDGEFIEFTNTGPGPVDMTGWSYSDVDAEPGDVAFLDVFGVVQPGESVIMTEIDPLVFADAWGLAPGTKVFGPNSDSNLSRNDQINLYDASLNLVDRLSYGDQSYAGTVRTQNRSCSIPAGDYGYQVVQTSWVLAVVGDEYGSTASVGGDIGSPGRVPEPCALAALALCTLIAGRRRA